MGRRDDVSVSFANPADAPSIAALRTSVAQKLTRDHGRGHWSSCATERGVQRALKTSRVLVARRGPDLIGTVRLEAKKPWAIDVTGGPKSCVPPRPRCRLSCAASPCRGAAHRRSEGCGTRLAKRCNSPRRLRPSCWRRAFLQQVWLPRGRPGQLSRSSAHLP